MTKQVDSPILRTDWFFLGSLGRGLSATLRNFWSRRKTSRYPEDEAGPGRFGIPQLIQDEQGQVRCVACHLCRSACPADCISIETGNAPRDERRRFPRRFEIDVSRCIICGYCALACPIEALEMGERRSLAARQRRGLLLDREQLRAG